jgi:hypothetical protein
MMSEPTAIPFNPVIPFHGDVKSFAMLGPFQGWMEFRPRLFGSMGADMQARYVTPFDTGWENRIHWAHEFLPRPRAVHAE